MIQAINSVVHGNATPDEAYQILASGKGGRYTRR